MTLNDLERRNSLYFALFHWIALQANNGWRLATLILRFFSLNLIALRADYVTVVENRCIMSVKYYLPVHFWPKLTHPAARCLYDSWATCYYYRNRARGTRVRCPSVSSDFFPGKIMMSRKPAVNRRTTAARTTVKHNASRRLLLRKYCDAEFSPASWSSASVYRNVRRLLRLGLACTSCQSVVNGTSDTLGKPYKSV